MAREWRKYPALFPVMSPKILSLPSSRRHQILRNQCFQWGLPLLLLLLPTSSQVAVHSHALTDCSTSLTSPHFTLPLLIILSHFKYIKDPPKTLASLCFWTSSPLPNVFPTFTYLTPGDAPWILHYCAISEIPVLNMPISDCHLLCHQPTFSGTPVTIILCIIKVFIDLSSWPF